MPEPGVADDEKRLALARVLASRTFGRSDQLRALLRYVCDAAFEGRAHQLNEYALGVSVLGRKEGYSPAEDSGVRSRAYELRSKLRSYYAEEAPDDPIRIEIDKGAYVPRFQRRTTTTDARLPEHGEVATLTPQPEMRPPEVRRTRVGFGIAAGVFLACAVLFVIFEARARSENHGLTARASTREMEAFWKPFLDGNTPLLISFEVRLFLYAPPSGLVVRDYRVNQMADAQQSHALTTFRQRMAIDELIETRDYADVGAVQAGFLFGRLLNRDVGLKSANALGWEDVSNSNVIFLGKSDVNPTIRRVLRDAALDFVDTESGSAVRNLQPLPGESTVYPNARTHGAGTKYGVITVLPGPRTDRHLMMLTGAGAELMWALAQCVADPVHVKDIMSHLSTPSGESPPAFQVLIEATFESNVPINIRYVTHHLYHGK